MIHGILLIIGVILFLTAGFFIREKMVFIRHSEKATGIVFKIEKEEGGDGPVYRPYFSFKSKLDTEHTYRHTLASDPISWRTGDEATIIYNPEYPNKAHLDT